VVLFWFAFSARTRSGSKCKNVFCDGGERRLKMVVILARVSAAMTDCGESCCGADGARDGGAWCCWLRARCCCTVANEDGIAAAGWWWI